MNLPCAIVERSHILILAIEKDLSALTLVAQFTAISEPKDTIFGINKFGVQEEKLILETLNRSDERFDTIDWGFETPFLINMHEDVDVDADVIF